MLSENLPIILIYLRNTRKHLSSNECQSSHHIVIFAGLIWCQRTLGIILLEIWALLEWKRHCVDHKGIWYAVRGSLNYSDLSQRDQEILKQQWMSFLTKQFYISAGLIWCPKLVFSRNLRLRGSLVSKALCWPWVSLIWSQILHHITIIHTIGRLGNTWAAMDVFPLCTVLHFPG